MAEICPPEHKHGETSTCYTRHGCRCTPCREWNTGYHYRLRHLHALGRDTPHGHVDATPTVRRLQALARLGWSLPAISVVAGVTHLDRVRAATEVKRSTAKAVAHAYDQLSMRVPTASVRWERAAIARTRNHAARQGWPPPLAWDDEDLDNPHAQPHQPPAMSGVFTLEDA